MASSLEALSQSHPVDIAWRAYELRPAGAPPMSPDYRARIEASQPRLNAMARDTYGVAIHRGPFGISSRLALIGAKVAESQGRAKPYHDRVMRAYWQEARDISEPGLLVALARDGGLDAAAFASALAEPVFDEQVQADIDQAYAYGLQGVPALVLDDKYLLSGAQPVAVLRRAVERVQAEPA